MARSQEKAQSMLYRFREQQAAELGIVSVGGERRPRNVDSAKSVAACEKWRAQVIKEISRKISRIHDPTISEYQIRDLNDWINKLMHEKKAWEHRLRDLGGPDYLRGTGRFTDEYGREIKTHKGYRYFGRAQDLPDVKEMLESQHAPKIENEKRRRKDLLAIGLDARYFGFDDAEDPNLRRYEAQLEQQSLYPNEFNDEDNHDNYRKGSEPVQSTATAAIESVPEIVIPTQAEVEQLLLERRKERLLAQYTK